MSVVCVTEAFRDLRYELTCKEMRVCIHSSIPLLLWAQQRFDRATLVHRAIALGDLLERQRQVEHFARVDLPGEDQIDHLRQIPTDGRRTAEQTDVPEEEIRPVERDTVRHADVADRTPRPGRLDRLPHRLLGPD